MRPRRQASVTVLLAAVACSAERGSRAPVCPAQPQPIAVAEPAVIADPAVGSQLFYLSPADFHDSTVDIDLPRAPRDLSLVVVVPDVGVAGYRLGWDLGKAGAAVRASVEALPDRAPRTVGHPLPPIPNLEIAPPSPPAPTSYTKPLPPTKDFAVYAQDTQAYVAAKGRLAHVGTHYAFYEDVTNRKNFTQSEYATIDQRAGLGYPRLTEIFGEPPDIDDNGHVIVFVSRTAAERRKHAQGAVDGCNLDTGIRCGGRGEIVYFWSLDGFPEADTRREFYATDYYPRTLLHETVHLCQSRVALEHGLPPKAIALPDYLREGQAMLPRYVVSRGNVDWHELSRDVDHVDSRPTPFDSPYALGGLLLWWMQGRYGPGVQRALIDASLDATERDPFAKVTGAPEPLVLAQFHASVLLDGTPDGAAMALEFIPEHVRSRLRAVPVLPIHEDEVREVGVAATGHVTFEIEHDRPVRVRLRAGGSEGVYALVVQPSESIATPVADP